MNIWPSKFHRLFSRFGSSLVVLGFMLGCTTPQATTMETAQADAEEIQEVEAGDDPEI